MTKNITENNLPTDYVQIIRQQALKDPVYYKLDQVFHAKNNKALNISGPADAQKTALMLSLLRGKPGCLLVADELRARMAAAELQALTDQKVLIFRQREFNLTDAEAVSREIQMRRLAILAELSSARAQKSILIVPAAAAMQKLITPTMFKQNSFTISVGMNIAINELLQELQELGFERVKLVENAGQYAARGDILDLTLPAADDSDEPEALRISFFDEEIESIRSLDINSQRSQDNIEKIDLYPIRELIIADPIRKSLVEKIMSAADQIYTQAITGGASREKAEGLRRICLRDAQRIEQKINFASLDKWFNWIYPDAASILDFALAARMKIFLDEPLRFRNRLDAAQADFQERLKHMVEKAQTVSLSREPLLRGTDVGKKLNDIDGVVAFMQIRASGNGLPGGIHFSLGGKSADSYRGREQKLIDLYDNRKSNEVTILFAGSQRRQKRLKEFLVDNNIHHTLISAKPLAHGFAWSEAGLNIVGSQDIFGTERRSRKYKHKGAKIAVFSDLEPGELVVHEEHGIGRFQGIYNLDNQGVRRDYLQIKYAGDDTLYIPIENLEQIQKYIGADGKEPKLSKLGGPDWGKTKERAKQSIKKLAVDLMALYAKREALTGYKFSVDTVWQQEFEEGFIYEETEDQIRCVNEIKADMESEKVMDRLLCGDVGFGKTEVAFRAMFKCVMDSKQAILLAPTTVLAQQHYDNLVDRMAHYPIKIGLLSRFVTPAQIKASIKDIKNGQLDIVVGTHRLLSKDVVFKNPGLLIVDEEQRFGVDHKERIKAISPTIDVLTLTATPIPRTLHLSMSGIRDISVIEEAPQDRRPVQTYVMEYDEEIVLEACLRELSRQGQVFYLFNNTAKIIDKAARIREALPGARVSYAHGKMGEKRLEEVINTFLAGEDDILVCTTIIESGIDMPNVNTIIVEQADRFGLSQLYQLRGRVGRSDKQAFAYITYQQDKILTEIAEKRLAAIRDFTELGAGFKIALRDLEVRGAGNLLGGEQHGHLDAIGYELYCKILDETIKELKGQPAKAGTGTMIVLDVDAFIPQNYITEESQRLDMYRRIASIDSFTHWQETIDEMLDRFGDVPATAVTLADIALVRSIAERYGFSKISQQNTNLILAYETNEKLHMGFISVLMSQPLAKGQLLFNAGVKPHIVYRQAGKNKEEMTSLLRRLLSQAEADFLKEQKENSVS